MSGVARVSYGVGVVVVVVVVVVVGVVVEVEVEVVAGAGVGVEVGVGLEGLGAVGEGCMTRTICKHYCYVVVSILCLKRGDSSMLGHF